MTAVTTHAERGVNSLSASEIVPHGNALGAEIRAVDDHKVSRHGSVSIICNLDRTEIDVKQRRVMHRTLIKGER